MDREDIVTRVKAETNMDTTEITTLCQYHIDEVQDRIASGNYFDERGRLHHHDFSWLIDYAEINCTPAYTTGTVAITQDATAVTGTDTSWAAGHVGWLMKVGTGDEFYEVSAVASTTSITLTSAFIGSTVSGSTYSLYF